MLTAIGLGLTVIGPLLISNRLSEPNNDINTQPVSRHSAQAGQHDHDGERCSCQYGYRIEYADEPSWTAPVEPIRNREAMDPSRF